MFFTSLPKNSYLTRTVLGLCSIILVGFLSSCSSKGESSTNLPGVDFGTSEFHESFLFSEVQNPPLVKTLVINFNEWATDNEAHVELVLIDEEETIIGTAESEVNLYVNDEPIADGRIKLDSRIKAKDSITLRLDLSPSEKSRHISGFIKMRNGNIERINNIETLGQQQVDVFRWNANQEVVMNPVKKGILWTLVFIVGLLFIWFLFIRNQVYPKMGIGDLTIQSPYYKSIRTKGKREVRLTAKSKRQGIFSKIFTGAKFSEKNPEWQQDITFTPFRKNQLRVKLPVGYSIEPFTTTIKKGVSYTIISDQLKVEIQYI